MPLVVLEAQALGKPVVASAVGSIPEMITDGESGFLCEPENVAAFCERILELFDSFEKRRAMGAAAREAVRRRHDMGDMIAAYLEVFQKIHRLAT
jgi:glycosyltransferase involved in cell wall biosynthesis